MTAFNWIFKEHYARKRIFEKNSLGVSNERNCSYCYVSTLNFVLIILKLDYSYFFLYSKLLLWHVKLRMFWEEWKKFAGRMNSENACNLITDHKDFSLWGSSAQLMRDVRKAFLWTAQETEWILTQHFHKFS